ncbi:MAG: DegT/DnrJ/EryC1/StrS aminotransferase family protein [Patescibacteria group bacterium]
MKNAFLHEDETKKALSEFIMQAKRLSMDVKCREFEEAFAKKQGSKHAVLFNSGGSANLAMLQSAKNLGLLKEGDLVGFSALTWSTNVMPIIQLGMKPVAIDCNPLTLNSMSTNLLETLSTHALRAFFVTNVLGFAGDLPEIKKICDERNILLLEDNCESLGTELPEGRTGNFGFGSSFSFFVAHHMSTIEGGMACTNDAEFAEMLRIVRANGWDRNLEPEQQKKLRKKYGIESEFQSKYTFYDLGFNLRPTEITGFLGLHQLQFLEENLKIRENNHRYLEKALQKNPDFVAINRSHIQKFSPFAFAIVCKTPALKEKYLARFINAGIEVRPMIAGNMQKQPFYKKYVEDTADLPGADFLHHNAFYCGNYPELTPEDLETIRICLRN